MIDPERIQRLAAKLGNRNDALEFVRQMRCGGKKFEEGGPEGKPLFDKKKVADRIPADGGYPGGTSGIVDAVRHYLSNGDNYVGDRMKAAMEDASRGNLDPESLSQMLAHEDAKRIYLGMPQVYGSFEPSPYRPTIGSMDNPYQLNGLLSDSSFENTILPMYATWKTGKDWPLYDTASRVTNLGKTAQLSDFPYLHRAGMSEGFDDNGQYISLQDTWDYNTAINGKSGDNISKWVGGKPFDIYQRYYLDDWLDIPDEAKGNPYIAPSYIEANYTGPRSTRDYTFWGLPQERGEWDSTVEFGCGGKMYPGGGKFLRTNLEGEAPLMYNPLPPTDYPIEVPLRFRPQPDLGDYEYPVNTGMLESAPIEVSVPAPVPGLGVYASAVGLNPDVQEEVVSSLFSDEAKARRKLKQRYAESRFNDSAVSGAGNLRKYLRERSAAGLSIDDPYEWVEGLNPETKRYVKYLVFDEDFDEKTGYTTKQFEDAAREHGYMAEGGSIHIKPSHRGRLTELKERTGKSEAELYNDGNPAHKKMVVFARNSREWNRADGGLLKNYYEGGGPYGVIPLGGDYLTYLQSIPEVSGGTIDPVVVEAPLPKKFHGSQRAARTYAEGYQKGAKPVSEAISRAGQNIFRAVDTVAGFVPGPVGAINWLGHMGADVANGEYGRAAGDLALAGLTGGAGYLAGRYVPRLLQSSPRVARALGRVGDFLDDFTYDDVRRARDSARWSNNLDIRQRYGFSPADVNGVVADADFSLPVREDNGRMPFGREITKDTVSSQLLDEWLKRNVAQDVYDGIVASRAKYGMSDSIPLSVDMSGLDDLLDKHARVRDTAYSLFTKQAELGKTSPVKIWKDFPDGSEGWLEMPTDLTKIQKPRLFFTYDPLKESQHTKGVIKLGMRGALDGAPSYFEEMYGNNILLSPAQVIGHEIGHEHPAFNTKAQFITTNSPYYGNNYAGLSKELRDALTPKIEGANIHDLEFSELYSDVLGQKTMLSNLGINDGSRPYVQDDLDRFNSWIGKKGDYKTRFQVMHPDANEQLWLLNNARAEGGSLASSKIMEKYDPDRIKKALSNVRARQKK